MSQFAYPTLSNLVGPDQAAEKQFNFLKDVELPASDIWWSHTVRKFNNMAPWSENLISCQGKKLLLNQRTKPFGVKWLQGKTSSSTTFDNIDLFHVAIASRNIKTLIAAGFFSLGVFLFLFLGPPDMRERNAVIAGGVLFVVLAVSWYFARSSWLDLQADGVPDEAMDCEIDGKDGKAICTAIWDGVLATLNDTRAPDEHKIVVKKNYHTLGCIPNGQDRLSLLGNMVQVKTIRGLFNWEAVAAVDYWNFHLDKVRFLNFGFSGRPLWIIAFGLLVAWSGVYPGVAYHALQGKKNAEMKAALIAVASFLLFVMAWWYSAGQTMTFGIGSNNTSSNYVTSAIELKTDNDWLRTVFSYQLGFPVRDDVKLMELKGTNPEGDHCNLTVYKDYLTFKTSPKEDSALSSICAPSSTYAALLKDVKYTRCVLASGLRGFCLLIISYLVTMSVAAIATRYRFYDDDDKKKARAIAYGIISGVWIILILYYLLRRKAFLTIGEPMPRPLSIGWFGALLNLDAKHVGMFDLYFRAFGMDTEKLVAKLMGHVEDACYRAEHGADAQREKVAVVYTVKGHNGASPHWTPNGATVVAMGPGAAASAQPVSLPSVVTPPTVPAGGIVLGQQDRSNRVNNVQLVQASPLYPGCPTFVTMRDNGNRTLTFLDASTGQPLQRPSVIQPGELGSITMRPGGAVVQIRSHAGLYNMDMSHPDPEGLKASLMRFMRGM